MKARTKSSEKGRSHSQKTGTSPKKNRKSGSYTQGDTVDEREFEEMLPNLSLKKPKRAYNFYVMEVMDKDKSLKTITDATKAASKKWNKMGDSDKRKYEEMAEDDKKRYQEHMAIA